MRVAVFRAADDGVRTARRLAALGHEAILSPVIEIVPTGCPLPVDRPAAVVFTSAHGLEAIAGDRALDDLRSCPAYCVGSRTEACAIGLGFSDVRSARADSEKLTGLLASEIEPGAPVLLVAGRDRKPVLESSLKHLGYRIAVLEVYEARAASPWPASTARPFVEGAVEAALHYSRRSAELALDQGRAVSPSSFLQLRHCCLSEDAATPLRRAGAATIAVADQPEEASLLACL